MTESALIASRSGPVPPWLRRTVTALGYGIDTRIVVDEPEDGRYYLPPGTLDRVRTRCREGQLQLVVIDGVVHPGQAIDLESALPATIRDRREIVWQRLATAGNDVAEWCQTLRTCRIERRRAEREQREQAAQGPSGTSGRVAELERRCQRARESLEASRTEQRRQVANSYGGVDADVVIVGRICGHATRLWASLTDRTVNPTGPLRPTEPATEIVSIGAHEVSMTTIPGLLGTGPEWYVRAVPGTQAALERADVVVAVDDSVAGAAELGEVAVEAAGLDEGALQAGNSGDATGRATESTDTRGDTAGVSCLLAVAPPEQTNPERPERDRTAGNRTAPNRKTADRAVRNRSAPGWVAGVVDRTVPGAIQSRLAESLPSVRLRIQLPYGDGAHALVSRLHDRGIVESIDYGDAIALTVELSQRTATDVREAVEGLGGDVDLGPHNDP
jgi:50S ribosomal subunit-associated GTPase HflX